jgi:DnaK suppressor protein
MPRKVTTPATSKAPAKKAGGHKARVGGPDEHPGDEGHPDDRAEFLEAQRELLLQERANYLQSADSLKAQADSLAMEHEPGDVQFDEEGGEGGTSNVDREMDLVLSAQARAAAVEIDRALAKIDAGTYGTCEQCGRDIPVARLQALPQATLCVTCKSGGLSSRR